MSPLQLLQLVGYSIGGVLPLWLAVLLISRRRNLTSLERLLFALAVGMGAWHCSNLIITLHSLFGFGFDRWTTVLRIADSIAVVSVTFLYSFLLHIHIHLRANAGGNPLKRSDVIGVYSSYVPAIFIPIPIFWIWVGGYAPMFTKVSLFVVPFALWAAFVLGRIALTEIMIARRSTNTSERRIMVALATSFVAILIVIVMTLVFRVGSGTKLGLYLITLGNLGSLLPSALLVYSIYRYRYLELIIEESLIVTTFAAVVLVIYLYGIRTIDQRVTRHFGVRAGVVEAVLILALTLGAAPLRRWIEKRFHKLFEREATLYREIVARIGSHAGQYQKLPELLRFVEERTAVALGLREVRVIVRDRLVPENGKPEALQLVTSDQNNSQVWVDQLLRTSRAHDWLAVEGDPILAAHSYRLAYPLRREDRTSGMLLVDGPSGSLTPDARAVLGVLSGQIAIAIEDCRLVEENVRLERKLAERERLAALGQMAATVAHEIKNPLSSIKSIAQVMSEDVRVSAEYARDLSLIVGQTDRLSQSVTQLLSFARRESPAEIPCRISELIASVVALFRPEADEKAISVEVSIDGDDELDGVAVSAVRDSLANLLLNAMQATQRNGRVLVECRRFDGQALISVRDGGPGVPIEIRQRIWEPFFTTKQRGTGLGLAIVRKRMEEAGGSARLASTSGEGASFELRVPFASP
jgi:signal transduction histidine kinase